MSGAVRRRLCSAAAIMMLQGCAADALRVDYAGEVVKATAAADDGARLFLAKVDEGRQTTNIALVVADPACAQLHPVLRAKPDLSPTAPEVGSLCVEHPARDPARQLSLSPIADELVPTLKLVEALAAYSDALATIIAAPKNPPSQALVDALALARAAQEAAVAVAGKTGGPVPASDDPRVVAAAKLIDFIGGLVREADQVKRLRALVAAQPDTPATTIKALRRSIRDWERARSADAGLRLEVLAAVSDRVVQARPPHRPEQRHDALLAFYAEQADLRREALLAPALYAALDALEEADADLRRVLAPDAKFTARERARIAALNRQRILTALGDVAELAKALHGA